jgi:hypothetical protein
VTRTAIATGALFFHTSKQDAFYAITIPHDADCDRNGLMCLVLVSAARALQKVLTNEQTQIVDTVNTMFTALQKDDVAKLISILAPDFYIFDGGRRFKGEAAMAYIKALRAAGKRFE